MRTIHPNAEHFERPRTERIAALWVCRNRLEAVRQENAAAEHEGSFIGEPGFAVGQIPGPRFWLKRQIGNVASAVL